MPIDFPTFKKSGLLAELTRVFTAEAEAKGLLLDIDYPPGLVPAFQNSAQFWTDVCQKVANGLTAGGLDALIAAAAQRYPGNPVFNARQAAVAQPYQPVPSPDTRPIYNINIFLSYSRQDEDILTRLLAQLKLLERSGGVTLWHDRAMTPGDPFDQAISNAMNNADVIVLLISPDFIASDYCYEKELKQAIERHEAQTARVVPVIARPTADWRKAWFGKLLALPRDGKPITTWPSIDEALVDVAEGIGRAVEFVRRQRG